MLVDKTLKSHFSYTYNIVQIKTFTHEVYNVGIILKDEIGEEYSFFVDVKNKTNRIQMNDSDEIDFLLQQVKNSFSEPFFNREDYTGILITQQKVYTTDKKPHDALEALINTYISIKPQ